MGKKSRRKRNRTCKKSPTPVMVPQTSGIATLLPPLRHIVGGDVLDGRRKNQKTAPGSRYEIRICANCNRQFTSRSKKTVNALLDMHCRYHHNRSSDVECHTIHTECKEKINERLIDLDRHFGMSPAFERQSSIYNRRK